MSDKERTMTISVDGAEQWGLRDTIDHCWMGNDKGPLIYGPDRVEVKEGVISLAPRVAAQLAAITVNKMLEWPEGRCVEARYDGTGDTKKDEVMAAMSAENAIELLMNEADDDEPNQS